MRELNLLERCTEVDVDGVLDAKGVRYLGSARRQPDGKWHVLADVGGALCLVEVRITPVHTTTNEP